MDGRAEVGDMHLGRLALVALLLAVALLLPVGLVSVGAAVEGGLLLLLLVAQALEDHLGELSTDGVLGLGVVAALGDDLLVGADDAELAVAARAVLAPALAPLLAVARRVARLAAVVAARAGGVGPRVALAAAVLAAAALAAVALAALVGRVGVGLVGGAAEGERDAALDGDDGPQGALALALEELELERRAGRRVRVGHLADEHQLDLGRADRALALSREREVLALDLVRAVLDLGEVLGALEGQLLELGLGREHLGAQLGRLGVELAREDEAAVVHPLRGDLALHVVDVD